MPSVKALVAALTISIALTAAAGPALAAPTDDDAFAPAGTQVGPVIHPDRTGLAPYDERMPSIESSVGDFYRAQTAAMHVAWHAPALDPAQSACPHAPANARFCAADVSISYDETYMRTAYERFGDAGAGIVMAHEFGHALQNERAIESSELAHDLQADCMAGAWLWEREQSMTDAITMPEIIHAATGLLNPGLDDAGFQRVRAAQFGFTQYNRTHDISACLGLQTI